MASAAAAAAAAACDPAEMLPPQPFCAVALTPDWPTDASTLATIRSCKELNKPVILVCWKESPMHGIMDGLLVAATIVLAVGEQMSDASAQTMIREAWTKYGTQKHKVWGAHRMASRSAEQTESNQTVETGSSAEQSSRPSVNVNSGPQNYEEARARFLAQGAHLIGQFRVEPVVPRTMKYTGVVPFATLNRMCGITPYTYQPDADDEKLLAQGKVVTSYFAVPQEAFMEIMSTEVTHGEIDGVKVLRIPAKVYTEEWPLQTPAAMTDELFQRAAAIYAAFVDQVRPMVGKQNDARFGKQILKPSELMAMCSDDQQAKLARLCDDTNATLKTLAQGNGLLVTDIYHEINRRGHARAKEARA